MAGSVKDMKGKTYLEVGCGRGACFKYVLDEFKPDRAFGIDLSHEAVAFN